MSEEQDSNPNYQIIRGCPFPNSDAFPRKNIEDAMDYVPRDGDIVIASYPKAGSTWMQYILIQIVSQGEFFPTFHDVTRKVAPLLEISGIDVVKTLESEPRIYKHHIPYDMVKKNDKSKYIYIYRNPEDIVVSFYCFINNLHPEIKLNFDRFFESVLTGHVGYGCYFKHFLSFYEHRNEENLLMVSYEKLHANKKEEILRIAKFLGEQYHQWLLEDEEVLDKIMKHTTFEYMKKNLKFFRAENEIEDNKLEDRPTVEFFRNESENNKSEARPTVDFFRKGIVGDGKNVLTRDQQERLKEAALKILGRTSVFNEWYHE